MKNKNCSLLFSNRFFNAVLFYFIFTAGIFTTEFTVVGFCQEKEWTLHVIDNSSKGADGVRLFDVNGDGLLDVVTGWEQGGITRIYFHPGYEKVTEPWEFVTIGNTPNVEDAVFVDLDNDGHVDVVTSTEGKSWKVFIHWAPKNKTDYTHSEKWQTEVLPVSDGVNPWMYTVPVQIDGENGVDLITGGKWRTGEKETSALLGWFRAPQNPRNLIEWTWHPLTTPVKWIMAIRAKDIDEDGNTDILVTDREEIFWLKNPGTKNPEALTKHWERISLHKREPITFPDHFGKIETEKQTVMFGRFADLDQDGLEDIVTAISPRIILYLRRIDKTGRHWEKYPITYEGTTGTPKGVAVADINKDGKQELVVICGGADGEKRGGIWLSYDQSPEEPVWKSHPLSNTEGKKFDDVYLYDFNGDGKLDAITTEEQGSNGNGLGVIWYENTLPL
jgi:hypothetical protein